jgi:hypothetical protein
MRATLYIMSAVAVVLAWIVTSRHKPHKPFAVLLSVGGLLCDTAAWALQRWALPPPNVDGPPLKGWTRLAGDADSALFLAWPAGIAALAMHTLARRSIRPVVIGYLATLTALIVGYPTLRGELLAKVYLAAELAAAFIGVMSFVAFRRRGDAWTVTTICTSIVVAGHLGVSVAGPYRFGLFGQAWTLAQAGYLLVYAVVILFQVGKLWEPRNT